MKPWILMAWCPSSLSLQLVLTNLSWIDSVLQASCCWCRKYFVPFNAKFGVFFPPCSVEIGRGLRRWQGVTVGTVPRCKGWWHVNAFSSGHRAEQITCLVLGSNSFLVFLKYARDHRKEKWGSSLLWNREHSLLSTICWEFHVRNLPVAKNLLLQKTLVPQLPFFCGQLLLWPSDSYSHYTELIT